MPRQYEIFLVKTKSGVINDFCLNVSVERHCLNRIDSGCQCVTKCDVPSPAKGDTVKKFGFSFCFIEILNMENLLRTRNEACGAK